MLLVLGSSARLKHILFTFTKLLSCLQLQFIYFTPNSIQYVAKRKLQLKLNGKDLSKNNNYY